MAGLVLMVVTGCEKSELSQASAGDSKPGPANQPLAAIHWLGIKRLDKESDAAGFLAIWRLPETQKVLAQTLDKLAVAPWRLSATNRPAAVTNYAALVQANPAAVLLRPLLDDLVQEECYLEVREAKDKSAQLALAVRLNLQHAGIWETNLRAGIEASGGWLRKSAQPAQAGRGWQIQSTNSAALSPLLRHIEFVRSGEWTIVSFATGPNSASTDLLTRIERQQPWSGSVGKNAWLETLLDLRRLSAELHWHWHLPQDWPSISLAISGDDQHVITRGELNFPKPLPFAIEPWNVPTNLIHEPVQTFTAVQGLKPWLSSLPAWQNLRAGPPPNQLFCWGQNGSPFLDYEAAPLADARKVMPKLGSAIIDALNPLLATNRMGRWERDPNSDGIVWKAPVITPFVQSSTQDPSGYLLAGLAPFGLTNGAPPVGTLRDLFNQTNLVYYDREITGPRVEAWLYISQLFRIISRRSQLPPPARSLGWLRAASPMLGISTTIITKTGPSQLSCFRNSGLGLTAPELHLLVDWLESSEFPGRPHSVVAKLRPPPQARASQ